MQCIADGKSIIIEGMHLDPGLYLYEFGHHGQAHLRDNGLHSNNGSLRTSVPTQAATKQQAPLQTDTKAAEGNKEQTEGLRSPTSRKIKWLNHETACMRSFLQGHAN
jgi:hypothetical protein